MCGRKKPSPDDLAVQERQRVLRSGMIYIDPQYTQLRSGACTCYALSHVVCLSMSICMPLSLFFSYLNTNNTPYPSVTAYT